MINNKIDKHGSKLVWQDAITALCAVCSILLIFWLVKFGAYGIDFTDESFYLLWIDDPYSYSWPASQFGFIYHPIYSLLGGDVVALRRFNILTTFVLAWALCIIFISNLAPSTKKNRIYNLTVSAGLATSALILFDSWLSTPNYNSLNLQALLVTAIGLVLANKTVQRSSVIGWVLIGIGGWLAFMSKPTTAAALGFGVLIYLVIARKCSIQMIALSVGCAFTLLFLSAFLFDGSVVGFVERFQMGTEFSMLQEGGYSTFEMLRIDRFYLDKKLQIAAILVFLTLVIALYCSWVGRLFLASLISVAFFGITALLTLGQIHQAAGFGHFQGLLIFSVVGSIAIFTFFIRPNGFKAISRSQWALAVLFLIFPYIYAFGTNGNYWSQGSWAAIFWLLAGLTLLSPIMHERVSWMLFLSIALAVQAVTATLIQSGFENPYRQPQPLRLNSSTIELGPEKSPIILSDSYATYISSAVSVADKAGFKPNTPVIDLTGQSPGIVFAIGAESIGQAWLIGGYPGSIRFTEAALANTSCERISTAWILYEPEGPRSISANVMQSFGSEFAEDYKKVGSWKVADGAGGYQTRPLQELYKPIEPKEIMKNCQMLRQVE